MYDKPISLQEKVFLRLFEQVEIASLNSTDRQGYEQSLKIYRDWYSVMQTQEKESFAKGIKEGFAEGVKKTKIAMIKNLKAKGFTNQEIAAICELSVDDIEKLT